MDRFQFGQTGGFPLTQERLDYMQNSHITALNAISGMAGDTTPCAVVGVKLLTGDWVLGGTVSDGWIWHPIQGLMPFVGGAFTPSTLGVIYTQSATGLTFGNNSTQNVQIKVYATIAPGAGSDLKNLSETRWHSRFGKVARSTPVTISGTVGQGGGMTISLTYTKDNIAGVVYCSGTVSYTNAQAISLNPEFYPISSVLPAGFRPMDVLIRPCFIRQHYNGPNTLPQTSSGYLTSIQLQLATDGSVAASGVRPLTPVTGYTAYFSFSYMVA